MKSSSFSVFAVDTATATRRLRDESLEPVCVNKWSRSFSGVLHAWNGHRTPLTQTWRFGDGRGRWPWALAAGDAPGGGQGASAPAAKLHSGMRLGVGLVAHPPDAGALQRLGGGT